MTTGADRDARRDRTLVVGIIAGLLVIRLVVAAFLPLAFDEAYYWRLSKHLAGGYYDHPPMIALVIRLGTLIAGDSELGVRLVAVLLGLPATWAVWRTASILFGNDRLAATAALFFNLTLIVAVGMTLATPDAPLLATASLAMFFLAKVMQTGRGEYWLAVGAAAGAALLSKYTALFLGVGILVWLLMIPDMRRWLVTIWPWLGGMIALALFMPVLMWNAENDWVSLLKQFGRVSANDWTLRYLVEHLVVQSGLATPCIGLLGAMALLAFWRGEGGPRPARVLLGAMILPLSLFLLGQSLHDRIEGNWTALICPAFAVAAAASVHAVDWKGHWASVVAWSHRLAAPVGLTLAALVYLQALFGIIPLGRVDPSARQIGAGWPALGAEIDDVRRKIGARAVLTTSYAATGWLSFYLPSRPPVVEFIERIRWLQEGEPDHALFQGPLLYVCSLDCDLAPLVRARYATVEKLDTLVRTRRGVEIERYTLYRLEGLRGDPLDRSPAVELWK